MSSENNLNPYSDNKTIKECSLHGTRKTIARHLMDSYKNKAHASGAKYIDIGQLLKFKNDTRKGSVIDHFYRAVAHSLLEKRELNATFDGNVYKIFKNINLSIAVDAPRGLVTPVLRNADKLSFEEFINERKRIITLVKDWKHTLNDILGGTFTLTNLGNYGMDFLLPIINPPQVAIMGIGHKCNLSISWDETSPGKPRQLLPVTMTYDHSVLDGVIVAEFLEILQEKTNQPEYLWDEL